MKGIQKSFIEEVKERMTVESALTEFIDNGFDHAKSRIDIIINQDENQITCMNDGKPMSKIGEYVSNFTTHIKQNSSNKKQKQISKFGKGSKKAFIKLGDSKKGSTLDIFTKDKEWNAVQHASIIMKECKKEDCFTEIYPEIEKNTSLIPYEEGTCMTIKNIEDSNWSIIHGVDEKHGDIRNDYYQLINYCQEHYGLVSKINQIDLYINGNKIDFEDPCLLNNLGDNVNKDGHYVINGICYWVHTYKCTNNKTKETVKFKTVYTFIPRKTVSDEDMPRKKGYEMYAGYYTYFGNRLMDNGGNYRKFFNRCESKLTTGGCDRTRIAIFCDKNEAFFKITSTKAEGIEPIKNNENFSKYKINGYPMCSILKNDLLSFVRLNEFDRKGKIIKELTVKDVKAFAQTYSVTKTPIKRGLLTNKEIEQVYNTTDGKQDKIKIEDILKEAAKTDDIASEIDANMILTVREKEILYELLRCSGNKKNKMEFYIKKILKLFDTKYGETTALKNEAA